MKIDRQWCCVVQWMLLALVVVGCGAPTAESTRTPRVVSTVSDLFNVQPTATPLPTSTPRPTREATPTSEPTITTTLAAVPTATAPLSPTLSASLSIYDEALDSDWSVVGSTVDYDLRYESEAYRGTYALKVERDLNIESSAEFPPTLEINLLPEAARSFPVAEIDSVSLWIYSGNGTLGVRDVSLGIVLSTEPFPSESASVNVIELELTMFGLTEPIEPASWVQLRYSPRELATDEAFAYLTGIYIENNVGFTQTILVDGVEIQFLTQDAGWKSAETVAISP